MDAAKATSQRNLETEPKTSTVKGVRRGLVTPGMEERMYVYIKSETNLWTVGFYRPDGKWEPESDHDTPEKAANRVHFLNGGKSCSGTA